MIRTRKSLDACDAGRTLLGSLKMGHLEPPEETSVSADCSITISARSERAEATGVDARTRKRVSSIRPVEETSRTQENQTRTNLA